MLTRWATTSWQLASTSQVPTISLVVVWLVVANILLYGFMALTAQTLSPAEYGLFAALFSIAALLNVVFSGVQSTSATRLARLPAADRSQAVADGRRQVALMTLVVLAILIAASPAIDAFVHADDLVAVLAAAAFAAVLLPWAALLGAYQGSGRFHEFSLLTVSHAALRIVALLALVLGFGYAGLLGALALTALPPLLWGVWAYGRRSPAAEEEDLVATGSQLQARQHLPLAVLVAVAVGFPALGDVVLVRHVYEEQSAGLYAGIALCGRVLIFVAIAISTVLYPRFVSRGGAERRRLLRLGLAATAFLVLFPFLAMWWAPALVLSMVAGGDFAQVSALLPTYALASVLFALATVYAFYALATEHVRYVVVVMAPCLAAQIAAPFAVSADLSRLIVVNLAIATFLLGVGWLVLQRGQNTRANGD